MITMTERKRKPRIGRPKMTEPTRKVITSFRCTDPFALWLDGLVAHCRHEAGWDSISTTDVMEKALVCLAREKGYPPTPPKR